MKTLRVIEPEPQADGILSLLDYLRKQAEAGLLSSVAYAAVYRDGEQETSFTHLPNRPMMLGAVAFLQHRIANSLMEDNE